MKSFSKHLVPNGITILEALHKLNKLSGKPTLFVLDEKKSLVGTLTDGDIRRGFVNGLQLNNKIDDFMLKDYHFLLNGPDPEKISSIKRKGISLLPLLNDKREIVKIYDINKLKTILPVDAVIMAGGRGERLKPLTDTTPKPMLKIGRKPIIEHTIDWLIEFGIENIYISVGYLSTKIMDYFGDGSNKGISIKYIEEDKPLGTIGALSLVEEFNKETILVMNSDLFTNIDYENLYLNYSKENADMAVASVSHTVNIPYAVFERDGSLINALKEKPKNTYYANAGIYLLKRKVIKHIQKNQFFNATDLMEVVIKKKMKLIHNSIIGYWIDIGRFEDYEKAKEIARHIKK